MSDQAHRGSLTPAVLIATIREQHKLREDYHRAEKRLTLQIKAVCRRLCGGTTKAESTKKGQDLYKRIAAFYKGGEVDPHVKAFVDHWDGLWHARAGLSNLRKHHEKECEVLAMKLPVFEWVQGVHGFGALGLAQIIGEAGDLSNYANPAKLWKRMGLAVIDGERQRKCADKEKALRHGYSPQRRFIMYVIAESLCKVNKDEYRALYLSRREHTAETHPDWTKGHSHNDAMRIVGKRLLRDLWRAWRQSLSVDQISSAPRPPS